MLLLPLPTLAVSVNTKVMRVLPKYFFVVLYDKKMKHLCVYPQGVETFDEEYIKKNCLKKNIRKT